MRGGWADRGLPIFHLPTCESTMVEARHRLEQGRTAPFAVVAEQQTAGRGRRSRRWESPPGGNLYLTLVLDGGADALEAVRLVFVGGLGLHDAITELAPRGDHWLKWPNDLYWGWRKLAGLLAERLAGSGGSAHLLLGIGLNLSTPAVRLPPGALSLAEATGMAVDRAGLLDGLLGGIDDRLDQLDREGWTRLREDWKRAARFGRWSRVHLVDEPAIVLEPVDLAEDGRLVVRTAEGSLRSLSAEEVSIDLEIN